ncbi:response regulator [Aliifodinibius sp. S!AR15-10]|uniref:response regulator n=1 Tax=Aliifodinibius sp. S!AR15-10 TaxID=2950437 RepID=UPI0028642BB5|nr:response regulator [Aliifodinibius sp. S!AR15-10]MDR8392854.1 response regulator [Aliifodinibius sp. S!AR15-10]
MAIEILIVDDSAVMRSMIKKTINLCEIEVERIHEAGNGREGLDIIENQSVDLVFIDVNMPVMDGMEMLNKVRQSPKNADLPILIVSTESNDHRIKVIDQHNAEFVHKPFTPEILREKILEVLGVKI